MTPELVDILLRLRELKRAEKLHVIQFLASELAHDEASLLQPGLEYPVWSPYAAFDAANVMLHALAETKANDLA